MNKVLSSFKNPIVICLTVMLVLVGGFHPFISSIISIALSVFITIEAIKNGKIKFNLNIYSLSVAAVVAFFFLTVFWSIDKLSAIFGFVKFLPLILLLIYGMQKDAEKLRQSVIQSLPRIGVLMTVLSAVLMQIDIFKSYFSVAGRLAGFFQYPNTFAVFLLVCILITGFQKEKNIFTLLKIAVFLFGIFYSGSRSAIIITVPFLFYLILKQKNKKFTISVSVLFLLILIGAGIYAAINNNFSDIGRFMKISFKSSTLLGRFLYFKDGLKIALKNPFGLGYLGYSYVQPHFQTGLYSVQFVHNDWLQILLDIGIIPFVLFAFSTVKFLFSKNNASLYKLIVLVLSLHSLLDFDLQYISIFSIFVLMFPFETGKTIEIKTNVLAGVTLLIVNAFAFYFGLIQFFNFTKNYETANKICFIENTQADTALLSSENCEDFEEIADRIIKENKYVSLAYNAKSAVAFSNGDFENVIINKENEIYYAPYDITAYDEYAYMLIIGCDLYEQNGDIQSMQYCKDKLASIKEKLNDLEKSTDKIAFMIKDKPCFSLNEEIEKELKNKLRE